MKPSIRLLFVLPVLALLAFGSTQALAQETPEEWQGIWEVTGTMKFCDTDIVFTQLNSTDTLCAGDVMDPGEGQPGEMTCTEEILTADRVKFTCTGSFPAGPGCTATITMDYEILRDGNSWTQTGRINTVYTGDCPPELTDLCLDLETTGERIGDAATFCSTVPVAPSTWGRMKSLYE